MKPFYSDAKRCFHGARFDVLEVPLNLPEGTVSRELVDHPGAVAILPFLDEDNILLIRNFRFAFDKTLLEIPAGTLEINEEPLHCAFRELEEETGYKAAKMDYLLKFYPTPGFCNEILYVYLAKDLSFFGQKLDQTEQIDVEVCSYDQAVEYIKNGQIKDSKTIIALLFYKQFFN